LKLIVRWPEKSYKLRSVRPQRNAKPVLTERKLFGKGLNPIFGFNTA